jgi:hypothetical protein
MLEFFTTEVYIFGVSAITSHTVDDRLMKREHFRANILKSINIKPPGRRSEYHLEWQGGLYITKFNKGINADFGSRVPECVAATGAHVMEPPYVVERRNFSTSSFVITDDFAFIQPAKAMVKVFKSGDLPFHNGMTRQIVVDYIGREFGEFVYGPDMPYRSPFTCDPNDWSRGYTPQPGDVSSSIVAYRDGLLYTLSFWGGELTGIDIIDIEIVAMNNLDQEPLLKIDYDRPPRSFEAALELIQMKEALASWLARS